MANTTLYIYNIRDDFVNIVKELFSTLIDLIVMSQAEGDTVIITSTQSLYYISIQKSGDTCIFGSTHRKQLNYDPHGLCVNHNNNLVEADESNDCLNVYNSSEDEINTINLPSGVTSLYLASYSSGSYIVTNKFIMHAVPRFEEEISWIDYDGAEQLHVKLYQQEEKCFIFMT